MQTPKALSSLKGYILIDFFLIDVFWTALSSAPSAIDVDIFSIEEIDLQALRFHIWITFAMKLLDLLFDAYQEFEFDSHLWTN